MVLTRPDRTVLKKTVCLAETRINKGPAAYKTDKTVISLYGWVERGEGLEGGLEGGLVVMAASRRVAKDASFPSFPSYRGSE